MGCIAMNKFDSVEKKIIAALESIDLHGDYRDSRWTKVVVKTLAELGDRLGYSVCATGLAAEYGCGAWLYDLVWYKEGPTGALKEIGLVLECEWSRNFTGIKFDFEKLLVAKSQHRVMIFSCPESKLPETFERLIGIINQSRLPSNGDKYLLLGVGANSGEFAYRHFVYDGA
jgi:hypothetical protein